ncbi:retrotransposon unclassified [Hordeum vulgare]|nr:retrotransposon unclassified [Hordeum vulgare]
MRMFNDCIADLALREIARVGARFTWTNKQEDPIQSVLDRVFVSPQLEFMFPLSSLKAVTRIGFDHTPLLFLSGEGAAPRTRRFRFETFWLEQTGFFELVRERWRAAAASMPRVFCAVDVWHHCTKLTRQAMKGWGANLGADLRARKGALLDQIQDQLWGHLPYRQSGGASGIRQFRPITVINVLARIFAKVCATRLSPVAERIAHPLQSAFLKGRRIHDGILALHEIVHEVASKGLKGIFLKPDFQKAYDSLDWSFLRLVMQRRGFDERWCSWVMQLVVGYGSTAINVNGDVGPFFHASRGVKQGDPISPLLFNLTVDALAGILDKARLAGHLKDGDIAHLKFLLLCFEEMSGLKINFDKSEVVVLGFSEEEQLRIADNLNCRLASFPVSYLGMPLAESRILVSGFDPLVSRVASRAEPWCGRFTSKGSKTILIGSNLSSLPMYMMGMYILPESVHSSFDKELARFFWQAGDGRPKYHMVKWADICLPKDRGRLAILASRRMNVALMLRWVWRITRGDGGLWLRLLEDKYLQGIPLLACSRSAGSQFWKFIQAIKEEIRAGLRFSVHNGSGTQFWLDPWLDGAPLRLRFPCLFAICATPTILVSEAALADGWHFEFCRSFGPAEVLE